MKQCTAQGVGLWRITFVSNLASAVMYLPLLAYGGEWPALSEFWQPAVAAALFIGGQVFTFLALQKGDVSVATPVLGLKPVIVALFVVIVIGEGISVRLWCSAALSAAGVALLNRTGGGRHHHVLSTIAVSLLAGSCFSLFDVVIQKFSPGWRFGRFLPAMFAFVTIYSFAFIPFFTAPLKSTPREAWLALRWGSFFMALQGLIFICSLAKYGDATALNVIFSSRGLWSVIAVWWVGHWFGNTEREIGHQVFRIRLFGAILMLAAITLVLI